VTLFTSIKYIRYITHSCYTHICVYTCIYIYIYIYVYIMSHNICMPREHLIAHPYETRGNVIDNRQNYTGIARPCCAPFDSLRNLKNVTSMTGFLKQVPLIKAVTLVRWSFYSRAQTFCEKRLYKNTKFLYVV